MEFLKIVRRRSFLSEVIYGALNIGLVVAVVLVLRATESPWPAIGLVMLSKWRVLAVRPRFWYANAQANLVDFIVGISIVTFMYMANTASTIGSQRVVVLAILALLYAGWLLFLKPKSKRMYVVLQAGVALFSGVAAVFMLSYDWSSSATVAAMWLIGYATAHHVLASYDETHISFISLLWGLVMAELGWLAYHWTIAYSLGLQSIMLPRVAFTVLCIGFIVQQSYDSFYHHKKIRSGDVILPLLFSISIVVVLPIVLSLIGGENIAIGI